MKENEDNEDVGRGGSAGGGGSGSSGSGEEESRETGGAEGTRNHTNDHNTSSVKGEGREGGEEEMFQSGEDTEQLYGYYSKCKITDTVADMKKDVENERLQGTCLRVITERAQDGPESRRSIIDAGGFEAIRRAMETHPEDGAIQTCGVAALSKLSEEIATGRHDNNGSTGDGADFEAQVLGEALKCTDTVVNVLYKNPCNEEAQLCGCRFFANVTDKHAPRVPSHELERNDIITSIISAMGCSPLNVALQTVSCTALTNLMSRSDNSTAIAAGIRDLCGIEVIMKAIISHRTQSSAAVTALIREGLRAVGGVFEHSREDAAEIHMRVEALGGVQLIAEHAEAPETAKYALYALAQIAGAGCVELDRSVLELAVEALHKDTASKGAQRWALVLLAEAVAGSHAARAALHEFDGLNVALRSFELYTSNAKVVAACCRFVSSYVGCDDGVSNSVSRATDLVVKALKKFGKDTGVQSRGVEALGSILAVTADFSGEDVVRMEAEMLGVVMETMRGHPGNGAVQGAGCRALSKSSPDRTPEPAATKCVLCAMREHRKDRAVQISACSFFFSHFAILKRGGEEAAETLKGAIDIMVTSLRAVGDDPEVCGAYCHALACVAQSTRGATIVGGCSGTKTLASVISKIINAPVVAGGETLTHRENAVQWACCGIGAILSLARTSTQPPSGSDGSSGGNANTETLLPVLKNVVKAMRAYPENEEIQRWGCFALCSGETTRQEAKALAAGGEGAFRAVANAMRTHPTAVDVQYNGCRALHALCKTIGTAGQEQAREGRALELVIAAMKRFPEDTRIQQQCCTTLGALTAGNGESQTVAGSIEGGVEAVVSAMDRHPAATDVQMAGCVALRQLCKGSVDNAVIAGIKGGIAALASAANHNINSASFIAEALHTLRSIVDVNPFNGATFCENGGVDMVIAAMKLYGSDVNVLSDGCHILAFSAFEEASSPQAQSAYCASDNSDTSSSSGSSNDETNRGEGAGRDYGYGILDDDDEGEEDDEEVGDGYDQDRTAKSTRAKRTQAKEKGAGAGAGSGSSKKRRRRGKRKRARKNGGKRGLLMGDDGGSVQALVNAMRAQPDLEALQGSCCLALAKAALRVEEAGTIITAKGVAAIVEAMLRFCGSSAEIQGNGCLALARLARHGPNAQRAVLSSGGVDAVIKAMGAHIARAEVQQWGCTALGAAALGNGEGRAIVGGAGGVQAVTRALQQHQGSEAVACLGCYALGAIVEDSAENKAVSGTCGSIGGCVATLKRFHGVRRAQRWAAYAISKIVAGAPANAQLFSALGGVDAVVGAMRAHGAASRRILSACCDALGKAALGCPAVAKAVQGRGGFELIMEGMGRFCANADVLESALWALGNMSYNSPEVAMALGATGGIEAVLEGVLGFHKSQAIQRAGLYALGNIASGAANKKRIGAAGGIEATVLGMNTFPGVLPIQESGLLLLLHVCTGEEENVQRAYEAGAVKTVLGILASCKGNAKIENISCMLLSELSHCSAEVQNAIGAGNGIRMIFSIMRRNSIAPSNTSPQQASGAPGGDSGVPRNSNDDRGTTAAASGVGRQSKVKILDSCLYALGNIAQRNINNQMLIGKQGIAQVCAVMRESLGHTELQEKGALVLGSVTSNGINDIQDMVRDAGGIHALLCAMREYPENVELQCNCCMALSNVVYHNTANQNAIGSGLDTIVDALRRFPDNEALQEYGCFALGSILEGNEANIVAFCRHREAFGAVVDAMRTHQYSQRILVRCCYTLTTCGTASAKIAAAAAEAGASAGGGGGNAGSKDTARYAQLVDVAVQRTVDCINNYSDNEDIQACGTQALASILRAGGHDLRATFVRASGVEVILSVMEYNANDPEILYWCSTALRCATDSVIESRQRIETCDGVRVILETMFAYPQSAEMQLVCCKLLTNIAIGASTSIAGLGTGYSTVKKLSKPKSQQDPSAPASSSSSSSSSSSPYSSTSSSSSLSLRIEGLSSALLDDVQITDTSPRREEVVQQQQQKGGPKEEEEALPVRLARCTMIAAGGGVDAVLGAMRSNPGDKEVQRCGCRALSAFAADNRRIRKLIGERGGVGVVLDALVHFQGQRNIVQSALEILASITTDTMANVMLVRDAHGLCLLLDVARRYSSVEAVQFLSCLVLGNLAVDRMNQAALGNNGAVSVAIAALNSFQRVANVQGVGCFALARLADESADNQKLLTAEGGVGCALAALKDFPQDRKVQKWALCTLYNATHDPRARAGAVAKRGVELALAALKRYRSEVCVQKWALYVLGRLAAGNEACRARIGEALGVDSVLEGMRAHPVCGKVQCAGCYALASIVLTRANQARMRTIGGIGAIVHAMTAFPADVDLQHYACLAIGRAVFGSAENATTTAVIGPSKHGGSAGAGAGAGAGTGALDAIVACMSSHSAVPEVQASGCFALFAVLSSNVARPTNLRALDTFFPKDFTHNGKRRGTRALLLTDIRATPALQKAFVRRGGVAAVVRALKALPENAATQEFGCGALGCYALGNAAVHDTSASASCIEAAMSALNRGRRAEDCALQASAVFAICSVVDSSPRDSLALGERDDVGVFSEVMAAAYDGDGEGTGDRDGSRRDEEGEAESEGWGSKALGLSITEFCCRILANIAVSNGAESQALVGGGGNIRLLVRVISKHFSAMGASDATRINLLNNALIAFGCTVFNNKANQDAAAAALEEAGCADIVLRILSAACAMQNFRMIGNCCHLLAGLCMNNAACKKSVVQCGGIEGVLRAMSLAKARQGQLAAAKAQGQTALQAVLSAASSGVASLASSKNSSVSNYDDYSKDGGSGGDGDDDAASQEQKVKRNRSFDVITQSAGGKGRRGEEENEAGVLQVAQGWGVKFLGIMSDRSRENTERICENGGVDLTSGVMRAYGGNEDVQVNGCFTLANLGACGAERHKVSMLEAGVLEGIIAALRAHGKSKKVLRYGCFALSNIGQNSARCKRRICAIGGLEAVAGVMRAQEQAEDEDIQRCCCFALCNVATFENPASQDRAVACGCVELLLSCMERFPENADIQSVCCKALGNIALKNAKAQCAVGTSEGALRTILAAMKRFPGDDLLQEHGCYALLSVMRRSSGGVLQTVPVEPTLKASAEELHRYHAEPLFPIARADLADIARAVTAALQGYQLGHPMLVNLGFGVFCSLFKVDTGLADPGGLFGIMKTESGDNDLVAKAALLTLAQFCISTVAALVTAPPDALGASAYAPAAAADVRAQCVETAVASMQKHPANVSIQSNGCLVLALCEAWAYLQDGGSNACAAQIRDIGGIKAVVGAMKHHGKTKAVLVNGGMALAGAAYHDRAGQAACVETKDAGACPLEAVLELMGRLLPDTEIQRVACIVLKNVTKPLSCGDDCDGDGEKEEKEEEPLVGESLCSRIVGAVEDTLLAHKKSLALQTLGVAVLRNVSQMGGAGVRACNLRHVRDLVLGLMERFPDSPDAQAAACKALAQMGMGPQEAERVLAAVTRFAACERVQAHGCHALFRCIASGGGSGGGGNTDAWVRASVAAAMAAMEKFPSSLRVQLAGCHVLTVANRRGGSGERAIALADAVLQRFPDERPAVEGALAVIANSVVYKQDISSVGPAVVRSIYTAMERHAEAESVLELCYTILTSATFQNDLNTSVFEAVGGVPALARTLRTFTAASTSSASLLNWAVNLLGNIAGKCQDSIQESGAIELVVAVMRRHPTHDLIQGNGCYALSGIADGHPANKRSIAAAGGVEAVVAALRGEYPESSGLYIRQWGCSALAALSQGSAELAALVGAAGGIEAVMAAMARSPGDRQIQLCGVRTFENAAVPECPENVARMTAAGASGEGGATAVDLVCRAMGTFRNDVQVQIRCLNALKALAPAAALSCEAPMLEHVGTALAVHLRNTSVVFCGCCVLEEMSLRGEPWPGRMAACANTVMRVLEKYIASNSIQRKCLETLNRVGRAAPVSISPETVVDSMERHANNAAILGAGFALLELTKAPVHRRALARAIETLLHMSGDFGGEAIEALLCGCRVVTAALAQYGSEPLDAALARSAAKLFSSTLIVLCESKEGAAVQPIYTALCDLATLHYGAVVQEKATGAIALSMRGTSADVELKVVGCAALREIATHKSAEDPCLAEELRVLAETLEAHPDSVELQVSCCNAIEALVAGNTAASKLVPEGAIAALVARTGEGWGAAVVEAALAALTAVVRGSSGAQEQALMCGGMEAVCVITANEGASSTTLIAALAFLTALTSGNADAQAVARSRNVLVAVKAVAEGHRDEPGVLEGCIHAFLGISGTSRQELREFAGDGSGVRSLADALKRWAQQGRFDTVRAGLGVFGAAYEAGCGELLAEAGVPELALSLLLTTPDAAACAHCLAFVARMARWCSRSADAFLGAGGLGAIVNTLATHSGNAASGNSGALEELKARGAAAVGALALFSQERALEICAGGGLEFLKALMRENPKSVAVQEQGALAISYVLSDDVVHKRYCMEANTIAQVTGALRLHRSSLVIEGSLYALKRLVLEQNKKWEKGRAVPQYVFYLDPDTILCKACWKKYRDAHPEKTFKIFFLLWKCDGCKKKVK